MTRAGTKSGSAVQRVETLSVAMRVFLLGGVLWAANSLLHHTPSALLWADVSSAEFPFAEDPLNESLPEFIPEGLEPEADVPVETAPPPAETAVSSNLIPTDPVELFHAGGRLMWAILAASVLALWFGLERLVMLRRRRVIPRAFVGRFIQHLEQGQLDADSAMELCEENGSPVASVFAHGIRKWGKPSVEVEQAIIDGGERQVALLRKHLRILNGVATVAPLLGLLGTVVGMIVAFNQIAAGTGMGKAEQLAGGIGMALLTTAAGLSVAIPSLILYMYLAGRVDALVMEMDLLAQRVVNLISAEGIAARPKNTRNQAAAAASQSAAISKSKQTVSSKS